MTLAELLAQGVRPRRYEALAIGQQLITAGVGVPTPRNTRLNADGSVECTGARETLEVRDIASLLHSVMAPDDVPTPLRRALSNGLESSDEPAFSSLQEFSDALVPFEGGDRRGIVRGLLQRAAAPPQVVAAAPARTPPKEAPQAIPPIAAPPVPSGAPRRHRKPILALVGALALIALIAGAVMLRPDPPSSATSSEANGPAITAAPPPAQELPPEEGATADELPADADIPPEGGMPVAALASRTAFSPSFAPEGGPLFFHTGGARDATSAIAMTSASGDDGRVVPVVDDGARNYHPQASPDGRHIAFDSDKDGERAIYVATVDGKNARRISAPGYAAVPTWSPDGTRLTYIRAEPGRPQVWNLWVQSIDGGDATRVTSHASGQTWAASWFPDNRRIAYAHEDKLVVTDLSTGKSTQFRSPVNGRLVRTPAVSPNGSKIVFQVYRDGVWMLDVGTSAMTRILLDPSAEEFAWTPDGRRIAFHTRRKGAWSIYVIPGA